ncbi:MAG: sugar phosphate isomerase/epimerase [Betaproteobacteria bacterium]
MSNLNPLSNTSAEQSSGPGRRTFLQGLAGTAAAALPPLMGLSAGPALANDGARRTGRIPRDNISIQMYTLRALPSIQQTLQSLAGIGFRKVEHAGFGGLTAQQFRDALRQAGLRASSGHMAIPQPWDEKTWVKTVTDALTVGQKFIIHPATPITYFPTDGDLGKIKGLTTVAGWQRFAADLNRAGEIARSAGLHLGVHNHFWEFAALDDDTPRVGYDILLAETEAKFVHLEVDLYWAWFAHRDPVQLLAYAGKRIRQFHVKDMRYDDHVPTFADAGTGVIDFARIFDAAGAVDDHEYIIERDDAGLNALTTAQVGYDYLSRIRF